VCYRLLSYVIINSRYKLKMAHRTWYQWIDWNASSTSSQICLLYTVHAKNRVLRLELKCSLSVLLYFTSSCCLAEDAEVHPTGRLASCELSHTKYCSLSYWVICDTILKLLQRNQLTLSALISPYGTNGMGTFSFWSSCLILQYNISTVPKLTLSSEQTSRPLQPMSRNKRGSLSTFDW